jgi:hypothetical protein
LRVFAVVNRHPLLLFHPPSHSHTMLPDLQNPFYAELHKYHERARIFLQDYDGVAEAGEDDEVLGCYAALEYREMKNVREAIERAVVSDQ